MAHHPDVDTALRRLYDYNMEDIANIVVSVGVVLLKHDVYNDRAWFDSVFLQNIHEVPSDVLNTMLADWENPDKKPYLERVYNIGSVYPLGTQIAEKILLFNENQLRVLATYVCRDWLMDNIIEAARATREKDDDMEIFIRDFNEQKSRIDMEKLAYSDCTFNCFHPNL